jgi:hypothetical protein
MRRGHLLLGGLEGARILCLRPQQLNDVRDILRLVDDRVTQAGCPVKVVAELPDNVREAEQSFYRGIPVLGVTAREILLGNGHFVFVQPAVRLNDFQGVG